MAGTLQQELVRKQGAQSHFIGFKLAYLNYYASEFLAAVEGKQAGAFYDSITKRFLRKFLGLCAGNFGDEPIEDPGVHDVEDTEDNVLRGCMTPEEAAYDTKRFNILRNVSIHRYSHILSTDLLFQKLAQWYRSNFGRVEIKPQKSVTSPLADVLGTKPAGAPRRKGAFAHYKKFFFDSRVKDAYNQHVLALQAQWDTTIEDDRKAKGLKLPTCIGVRTAFTSDHWKAETNTFRNEVAEEAEALYLQSVTCWEVGLKAVKTPGQYHEYVPTMVGA